MKSEVTSYLSEIGRRGGKKSRRPLSSEQAKNMVLVREARRAYRRFYHECFWSFDPEFVPGVADVKWVGQQLMKNGRRDAWAIGVRLCR